MIHPNNSVALVDIDIGEKLIPSWTSFVIQFAALIVLLLVVFIFAYKPIKKLLKKRADYIEDNIKEAEKNRAIAEKNMVQSEETILASKKNAAEIIEKANNQAKANYDASIEQTRQEIIQMKLDAEKDIERSRQDALEEIHDEMVDVALSASSEILKREVNSKDNARLAEEFIEKLD